MALSVAIDGKTVSDMMVVSSESSAGGDVTINMDHTVQESCVLNKPNSTQAKEVMCEKTEGQYIHPDDLMKIRYYFTNMLSLTVFHGACGDVGYIAKKKSLNVKWNILKDQDSLFILYPHMMPQDVSCKMLLASNADAGGIVRAAAFGQYIAKILKSMDKTFERMQESRKPLETVVPPVSEDFKMKHCFVFTGLTVVVVLVVISVIFLRVRFANDV